MVPICVLSSVIIVAKCFNNVFELTISEKAWMKMKLISCPQKTCIEDVES
jgi:hypothetical protein